MGKKGEKWRVVGLYITGDMKNKILKEWAKEKEEGINTLIGGDFNAKTGNLAGGLDLEEEECDKRGENRKRKSKDEKVNKEGRGKGEKKREKGK